VEDNTPVYSEANNRSKIIIMLKQSEIITGTELLGEFDEWIKVKKNNTEGYILKYDTNI
jgi:hypothetical protein